jgi:uncharacterized membrane protein (UPF0182 family)
MDRRLQSLLYGLVLAFVAVALFGRSLLNVLTESWWFDAEGFASVFWTKLRWQVAIWAVTFSTYVLGLTVNYRFALRFSRSGLQRRAHRQRSVQLGAQQWRPADMRFVHTAVTLALLLVAAIAAVATVPAWETVLKFLHATPFNRTDPLFGRDIGFYVFRLPLYEGLHQWAVTLLLVGLALVLATYSLTEELSAERGWQKGLGQGAKIHISLLVVAIALLVAVKFWLARFDLLYSADGVVFGADFTDVHARLPAFTLGIILTLVLVAVLIGSLWQTSATLPLVGLVGYVLVLAIANGVYPAFLQRFVVAPNELAKEKPFIANNIAATQAAFGLAAVDMQEHRLDGKLDRQSLDDNQPTIRNIRLWDYRPLLSTYQQLQEIRLYYRFNDVDVDRYTLDGNYQQVMLSPREIALDQLPVEAQTWVNQRLKYTHGYGLVMSPVTRIKSDGLPELWIRDIPPVVSVDVKIDQPRIYFGEGTDTYVFTGATTDEFDYPLGNENAANRYSGRGGVPLSSPLRRLAYAVDFGSLNILISSYLTDDSRLLYHRSIGDRVRRVAPFLQFDSDPYLAVVKGRLQWIVDAYTVSDRYPYSEPMNLLLDEEPVYRSETLDRFYGDRVNYVRNSVKVVVDAYDGTMRFLALDEAEPVLKAYRQIFPDLFQSADTIEPDLRAHFRYPMDLFKLQAQMYLIYHMSEPEVFYNREDAWRFPTEQYEDAEQLVEPYYVIMRLPQEQTEEFLTILPFTPVSKNNMVAWMAARSDGNDYGKLLLYEFPKQALVFGPRQIEARIDQTPEISQQLTLWSQEGSRVIRGNLLAIPIEQSLLYVEPVYLRAEQGELPELRRVIVVYGDEIAMEETLNAALAAVFGKAEPVPVTPSSTISVPAGDRSGLVRTALETYQQALDAQRAGNWARYGELQDRLGDLLQQLNQP